MVDRIAIDAMGGDFGPAETVPAAASILKQAGDFVLILVGQEDKLRKELAKNKLVENERLQVRHAPEVVEMHELPSSALRNKKQSSMRLAIELVRENEADACVSAGNTGALMAISRYILKMLPGIDRPAICSIMPGIEGHTRLLDLGANINSSSDQLFQFALMGVELTSAVENIENPTVGLLNVGSEETKGDDRIKQASLLLSQSHLNYIGFVEGTDIYAGKVDVIVTDGFTGNVALKASEGVARLVSHHVRKEFSGSLYGKLSALIAMPILKDIHGKIDPGRYNGASLLGLRRIVVKSHGSADRVSFATAIREAIAEVDQDVPQRISHELERLHNDNGNNGH
ncbi:MAG: phosphate acyltransferase PlsX [Gammaproteobacteria bacterium]